MNKKFNVDLDFAITHNNVRGEFKSHFSLSLYLEGDHVDMVLSIKPDEFLYQYILIHVPPEQRFPNLQFIIAPIDEDDTYNYNILDLDIGEVEFTVPNMIVYLGFYALKRMFMNKVDENRDVFNKTFLTRDLTVDMNSIRELLLICNDGTIETRFHVVCLIERNGLKSLFYYKNGRKGGFEVFKLFKPVFELLGYKLGLIHVVRDTELVFPLVALYPLPSSLEEIEKLPETEYHGAMKRKFKIVNINMKNVETLTASVENLMRVAEPDM